MLLFYVMLQTIQQIVNFIADFGKQGKLWKTRKRKASKKIN